MDIKQIDLHNEDGYPTEEALTVLEKSPVDKDNLEVFLAFLKEVWYLSSWGFHRKNKDELELHTAGWSGNEDIIGALEKNESFWKYLVIMEHGGHYWFNFRG